MLVEDIDTMQAGQAMDKLVAQKVMGYYVYDTDGELKALDLDPLSIPPESTKKTCKSIGAYSTDIIASWEVVEALKSMGFRVALTTSLKGASCLIVDDVLQRAWTGLCAEAVSLAICRAALKATAVG